MVLWWSWGSGKPAAWLLVADSFGFATSAPRPAGCCAFQALRSHHSSSGGAGLQALGRLPYSHSSIMPRFRGFVKLFLSFFLVKFC